MEFLISVLFVILFGYIFLQVLYFIATKLGEFSRRDSNVSRTTDDDFDIEPYIPPTDHISYDEYKDYLKTDIWYDLRKARLAIDNYTCQYCGSNLLPDPSKRDIGHVHHLHYRSLQNENVRTDLVSLCRNCHLDLHDRYSLPEMEFYINMAMNIKHRQSI
jgi:hypothetical protein